VNFGLGLISTALRFRGGSYCVTSWNGRQLPGSMLIIVTIADGNSWMRPFARTTCRLITDAALGQLESQPADRPNYAGCVLIDRPTLAARANLYPSRRIRLRRMALWRG
jgi:hypothetical protein